MVSDDAGDQESSAERQFGWSNMFVGPEDDPRSSAASVGERSTLTDSLYACGRTLLELKCRGLDAQQMARRSVMMEDLSANPAGGIRTPATATTAG